MKIILSYLLSVFINIALGKIPLDNWSCGTHQSLAAINSVLSSQKSVFGNILYQISNASARSDIIAKIAWQEAKIKVGLVNCAGDKYNGFDKTLEKLNEGFLQAKISFQNDGIQGTCTESEMNLLSQKCRGREAEPEICPEALDTVATRIQYTRGVLVIVTNMGYPGYILGQADFGLWKRYPWVMYQAVGLPDNIPTDLYDSNLENRGIIPIHEMGHHFGLLHTFENGCSFPGDYIPDTPYELESGLTSRPDTWYKIYECCLKNGGIAQCSVQSCGNSIDDDINNIMGYNPHSCQLRFTSDQVAAMQATLLDKRPQWVGRSSKPTIDDIAVGVKLDNRVRTVEGSLEDGTDSVIEWISNCPSDSIWKKQYQYNPGVIGQPRKQVYRFEIPSSTRSIKINHCKTSRSNAVVSLTYLECRDYLGSADLNCTCQVSLCAADKEITFSPNTSPEYNLYLILSNDHYTSNDLSFSMDVDLELRELQPPPMQSPPSVNLPPPVPEENAESISRGMYMFGPAGGPCKGKYISVNPGGNCLRSVRMRSFKQASSNSRVLGWRVNGGQRLESIAASKSLCKSKYLAASKSGVKLGGNAWKWKINVVRKTGNRYVVNLVSQNKRSTSSYLKVKGDCTLTFTSNNRDESQFEAINYTY